MLQKCHTFPSNNPTYEEARRSFSVPQRGFFGCAMLLKHWVKEPIPITQIEHDAISGFEVDHHSDSSTTSLMIRTALMARLPRSSGEQALRKKASAKARLKLRIGFLLFILWVSGPQADLCCGEPLLVLLSVEPGVEAECPHHVLERPPRLIADEGPGFFYGHSLCVSPS